jgi:methylmalonyl-CoA/ethylmalonyl-CoA epimerase
VSEKARDRFGLGGIDQIGYVVEDLSASMPHYEALFGPFETYETVLEDAQFRGEPISCKLKIATNNSGPIEIELIEVMEGETPHSEHLREHGEGPQHVRFRVSGIDDKIAELESAGYKNIFFKRFSPEIAFSYLESPGQMGGKLVELLEMP